MTGVPRPTVYWGLDSSWIGMVQFGAHAMNGTEDGVLHHTMSSKSEKKYWYNGVEVGEVVQVATIAGYYGIPTILVTGDEAVCRETKHFLGDACVSVAVKKGIAREAAILYPFEETRKALYEGARKAMEAIPECIPFTMDTPVKGKMQYLQWDSEASEPKFLTKEAVFNDPRNILNF
ncbi:MAG: hypothetical protein DRJ13_01345 [Bacteroidetes bacterium]|nr:MAG: hypothetical protein DRJ13_01345 [Bacteroidota bacterium]